MASPRFDDSIVDSGWVENTTKRGGALSSVRISSCQPEASFGNKVSA